MRILIIEDEPLAVGLLSAMITRNILNAQIVGICDSVESSIFWLNNNVHPDLAFMDVHLADGLSFEIFKEVRLLSPIIFTTAYDQFTLQAFKVNSIDYLLKPIGEKDFIQALDKYFLLQQKGISINQDGLTQLLVSGIGSEKTHRSRFLLRKGDRLVPVEANSIYYLLSEEKTTLCITRDGQQYFMDYTLDALEEQLDPARFFRANRKYLITRESLEDIRLHLNGKLKITLKACTDSEIYVSRERAGEFRKWLGA